MGNRYIHPEDEIEINLSLKLKIKAVGDHSSIGIDTTKQNYEFIKDNGDLVESLKDHIESQIMLEGSFGLDFIDHIQYEVID